MPTKAGQVVYVSHFLRRWKLGLWSEIPFFQMFTHLLLLLFYLTLDTPIRTLMQGRLGQQHAN